MTIIDLSHDEEEDDVPSRYNRGGNQSNHHQANDHLTSSMMKPPAPPPPQEATDEFEYNEEEEGDEEKWFAEQEAYLEEIERPTKGEPKKESDKSEAKHDKEDHRPSSAGSSSTSSSSSLLVLSGEGGEDGGGEEGGGDNEASSARAAFKKAPAEKAAAEKACQLSAEQKGVLRHVMEGNNVYYSGKAGSGKSHLLRAIIDRAPAGKTFITASTGIAAIDIGGTTLHSFAGIGLGEEPLHILKRKASTNKTASANWTACEVLIVDEVSMLHGALLTKLDEIAKHCKGNMRPFGGIQLIFTGDFFQLPPVRKGRGAHDYAFLAPVWQELFRAGSCFELSTIFRQAESALVDLLSDVRYGRLSPASINLLHYMKRELQPPKGINPTLLYATNERVDGVNNLKLSSLQGEEHIFNAEDDGKDPYMNQIRKHCLAEPRLRLRKGAQVMLIKNINQARGLVNGAQGTVLRFTTDEEHYPVVRFTNGEEQTIVHEEWSVEMTEGNKTVKKATRRQIPLKLGWAITIHKSQGMGLEWLECKLDDVFEDGQGYVALSRAIKLDGLRVISFKPERFRVSSQVVAFYDQHIKGRSRPETSDESTWRGTGNWHPSHPKYKDAGGADVGGGAGKRGEGPYGQWNSGSTKRARIGAGGSSANYDVQWLPRLGPSAPPPSYGGGAGGGAGGENYHTPSYQLQGGGGGSGGEGHLGAYRPPNYHHQPPPPSAPRPPLPPYQPNRPSAPAPRYHDQSQRHNQQHHHQQQHQQGPRPVFAPASNQRGRGGSYSNSSSNGSGGGRGSSGSSWSAWGAYEEKKGIPNYFKQTSMKGLMKK